MEFVARRPSFPVGYKLGNFSPVQRVLHSDELAEVYLLERGPRTDLLLVKEGKANSTKLHEWWKILGTDLTVETVNAPDLAQVSVVRVPGGWWPENQIRRIPENRWKSFLVGTLNRFRAAYTLGLQPNLTPTLMWLASDSGMLVPLCVTDASASEKDVLRGLAAFLISESTGIHADSVSADGGRLRSWNRCIPPELFTALHGCLSPGEEGVSTFDALEDRITGKTQPCSAAPGTAPERSGKSGLNNIAGMQGLKEWLRKEVLGPLRNPQAYEKYRIGIPNGILFYGPPGCGKTYVARQLAEELGYFFLEVKPSDVASPYIHSTVLRIRELFDEAVEKAPSVLFIDEFDAFAPTRADLGGHQQYKSEEVNEFLANLDGAAGRKVLVIAATNTPEKIDPAIRRTGRFDKLIFISPPDAEARKAMLEHHLADRPVDPALDAAGIAVVLDGYSASDLKLLVDEAARRALDREVAISTETLLDAMRRVPPSITEEEGKRYDAFPGRGF